MTEYEKYLEARKTEIVMSQPANMPILTPERMEELRKKYENGFQLTVEPKFMPPEEIEELGRKYNIPKITEEHFMILYGTVENYKKNHKPKTGSNIVQKIISSMKLAPPPKPFAGLLIDLSDKQLDKLFVFLTTENKAYSKPTFIDKETDRQSFDFVFGGKDKPNQFKPIEWQANNQWLREILAGLQIEKAYHKVYNTLTLSNEIERQAADYFTKKGKAINIKPTKQLKSNPEYKAISKFLATL